VKETCRRHEIDSVVQSSPNTDSARRLPRATASAAGTKTTTWTSSCTTPRWVRSILARRWRTIPWERMERNARAEGVPLAAKTLASPVSKLLDLFDPVVRHIREACLLSTFTALDAT
jgi:hypothetical protein